MCAVGGHCAAYSETIGKDIENMKIKVSLSQRIFDVFNVVFMLCLTVIMVYPIWYILCASFSDNNRLMAHMGVMMLPKGYSLNAYKSVASNPMILSGYKNTLFILLCGVFLNIIMTSIAAYCLSRKNVYWSGLIMKFITVTMFFSGGLIPTYLLVSKTLHMNDSLLALIVPSAINTYYFIIMRTSFAQMPESLIESARLDGAGHVQVMAKIVMPLSMPIIAVMILYYAVDHWNSWFFASIILSTRSKMPLQLVLREILIQNDTSSMMLGAGYADQYSIGETIKYAVIIVATVPILIIYPFLQRYFVKGVMIGAVKG